MTALLTAAAVVTALVLIVSAANTASRATGSDPHKRGSWGIAHWNSERNRPLNLHQRRWQTVLLSAKDNDSRWLGLVTEIQNLEQTAGIDGIGPVPDKTDQRWIEASIANLESSFTTKTTSGDPAT